MTTTSTTSSSRRLLTTKVRGRRCFRVLTAPLTRLSTTPQLPSKLESFSLPRQTINSSTLPDRLQRQSRRRQTSWPALDCRQGLICCPSSLAHRPCPDRAALLHPRSLPAHLSLAQRPRARPRQQQHSRQWTQSSKPGRKMPGRSSELFMAPKWLHSLITRPLEKFPVISCLEHLPDRDPSCHLERTLHATQLLSILLSWDKLASRNEANATGCCCCCIT